MNRKIKFIIVLVGFVVALVVANKVVNKENTNIASLNNGTSEEFNNEEIIKNIDYNAFKTEVLNSDKTILVDFYADWCGPCQMLSPVIEEIASENTDSNIGFVKVNIDKELDLANEYGVMSIPTLVVIKNGEEVDRSVGYIEKHSILNLLSK